jgi:hypothetical protein
MSNDIRIEILVEKGADRRGRMCRCFTCGIVEKCTPQRDFYTTPKTGNYLVCTTCFVTPSNKPIDALRVAAAPDTTNRSFVSEVRLPCTFCNGALELVREVKTGEHGMIHLAPACKKFEDTDLIEFMVENRRNLGIPDPEEDDN